MRPALLAVLLALAPAAALAAPAPAGGAPAPGAPDPKAETAKIAKLYDQAFENYQDQRYSQAIKAWSEILRIDPAQKTARQMISDIRLEIMRKNRAKLKKLFARVREGSYPKALLGLQSLIEEDETHPRYKSLQTALEEVSAILPQGAPTDTKAWRIAILGLTGPLGVQENAKLAYNALRYAMELDPAEGRIKELYNWLLARHPELNGTDPISPGMKFMECKQLNAVNHIYDTEYNQAVDTLNEILALEPQDLLALKRLGSAYYSMGHRDKAREAWTKALQVAPDDPQLKKFLKKLDQAPVRRKK